MRRPLHERFRRAAPIFAIALPVLLWASAAEAASPVIERLNRDRTARDLPPLESDERLDVVARAVVAEVHRAGSADAVVDTDAISRRLRDEGYAPRLVVTGYVVGTQTVEELAARWPTLDPQTWGRMMDAGLRDVSLARGTTSGETFLLLLAAVSQNDAKAEEAEALADLGSVRQRVLELTNSHREEAGVVELRADPGIHRVAQAYAEDMLGRGFYGHTSPEGQTAMDRLKRGRVYVQRAGENLAEGPPTAESAVEGWFESPSHRDNLLHAAFRRMGLGVAAGEDPDGEFKIYWVQVFTSHRRPIL